MDADFSAGRRAIDARLAEVGERHLAKLDEPVREAALYALTGQGKRLRPLLLTLAFRACGGKGDVVLLSCAPEIIHTYSLVHDDLPCMDDDDLRRGRPTVHKVYGTRAAILAGVALIPLAVSVASEGAAALSLGDAQMRRVIRLLLDGAGSAGMIGGQVVDLAGEGEALSIEAREAMHRRKTGALIVASLQIGAVAGGATDDQVAAFAKFGRSVGLAFQIMDDVLDVTSTSGRLGKTVGRDAVLGKSTYPALLGVEGARNRADTLTKEALATLAERDLLTRELTQVANFMVARTS